MINLALKPRITPLPSKEEARILLQPSIKKYVGIDPGKHGGIAILNGGRLTVYKMPETESEAAVLISDACTFAQLVCIERVTGWIPNDKRIPMSTMFTMGWWTGGPLFVALSCKSPVKMVQAAKWQRDVFGEKTGGDKKRMTEHARVLYPGVKFTQQVGDAVLIAHWAAFHSGM